MAHDNNCQNCGKSFSGNISRRFCTDACRKYYKRHGETSLSGMKPLTSADKAGQGRTMPRSGGSSLGTYAAKKGLDLLAAYVENSFQAPKSSGVSSATTPTNSPLQVMKAGVSLSDPTTKLLMDKVGFSEDFAAFLGLVCYPFKMLVWGLPGSGKSTFCMKLANEIATKHPMLYIAGEEALNSPTLLDKQRRTLATQNANRCVFLNRLPKSEQEWKQLVQSQGPIVVSPYKAIFYDSVTKLGITPFYVNAAANDFRLPALEKTLSHVFITHAQKDGQQYRGDGSWGHEVDIIVRVEKGVATTEKNRFGEVGRTLRIF